MERIEIVDLLELIDGLRQCQLDARLSVRRVACQDGDEVVIRGGRFQLIGAPRSAGEQIGEAVSELLPP